MSSTSAQPSPPNASLPRKSLLSVPADPPGSRLSSHQLSVQLNLQFLLGTDRSRTRTANAYVYNQQELIYYVNDLFVRYDTVGRGYVIVEEEAVGAGQQAKPAQVQGTGWDWVKEEDGISVLGDEARVRTRVIVSKFYKAGLNSLFMVLKKINNSHYLSLYWPEGSRPPLITKISESEEQTYTNCDYHPRKGYFYLLYKTNASENPHNHNDNTSKYQHLKIVEIQSRTDMEGQLQQQSAGKLKNIKNKVKVLLNCPIKKTGGSTKDLDNLTVGENVNEVYLYGADYFRQWSIMYNEKAIKQSNYRNTERSIKREPIISVTWLRGSFSAKNDQTCRSRNIELQSNKMCRPENGKPCSQYLVVFTTSQVLFVRDNQLMHVSTFPSQSQFQEARKETAEALLQRSLNQIYKTKFRVEPSMPTESDEQEERIDQVQTTNEYRRAVVSVSNVWTEKSSQGLHNEGRQAKIFNFCASLDNNCAYVFKINPDYSIKIEKKINTSEDFTDWKNMNMQENSLSEKITNISASPNGELLLFTDASKQHYLNVTTLDEQNNQLDPLYACGHSHTTAISSISSPEINNQVATVSEDGALKIWNYGERDRNIAIDAKFKVRPVSAVVHPCGFVLVVNFGVEIKVYGIISAEIEEIVSTKTSDFCSSVEFCKNTNFLVSNQKSAIKIYDPFSLYVYHKIEIEDLRLEIRNVKISDNGEHLVYQCCNNRVYRKLLCQSLYEDPSRNLFTRPESEPEDKPITCHKQSEEYICYYYNFGTHKGTTTSTDPHTLTANNIFIGFTKSKLMVLYSNYGENLVAEFPTFNGIHVVQCCVTQHMMFLGTNAGTILVYRWPILQSQLEMEILQTEAKSKIQRIGYYKAPKPLYEYTVWKDYSPVTCLYKIPNKHELVVGSKHGLIAFISYSLKKQNHQFVDSQMAQATSNERKKMVSSMNNLKFMKIADIDKITKLIEKTENDINKIDYEIQAEKKKKNHQLVRQQQELKNNTEKRKRAYVDEKNEKFVEQHRDLKQQEMQFSTKKAELEHMEKMLDAEYKSKADFERQRIEEVKKDINNEKMNFKSKIRQLMDQHKQNIKSLKQTNLKSIRELQKKFQQVISTQFNQQATIGSIKQINFQQESQKDSSIINQSKKVQQLQTDISVKQVQLSKISAKAEEAKQQDEEVQLIFQKNLQKYNQYRYQNLMLHSELLKMQSQLHERTEILEKKDEIIQLTYQEKEINETYKQFVSGTIESLQNTKENAYKQYIRKEHDLRMLFEELTSEVKKSETKKLQLGRLGQAKKIYERECEEKQGKIKVAVDKLNGLKKFLLLQGVSEDSEHKKICQEQQKLLNTIRWLEKRFRLSCMNEKKLTSLKKSGVNQIINQNKNLLEECNQLREEGILYENQIYHLSEKLSEANKIIELEKKVKNQKDVISHQSEQLNQIRRMFNEELSRATAELVPAENP